MKQPKQLEDMKPGCASCRYWREQTEPGDGDRYGTCHRYPPTMLADDEACYPTWVITSATEFCGELVSVN